VNAAVLTVSDGVHTGTREDTSGDLLDELLRAEGYDVVRRVVPDERDAVASAIIELAGKSLLILTTGGTGFAPRDVTPEATRDVLDREAPGIAEAMRAASREHTPLWMVSRGVAGTRGATLIVNFPGNPPAIEQAGAGIAEAIPHALALLAGRRPH